MQPVDAAIGQGQHRVQPVLVKRRRLGGPLDFDVAAVVDAHDVHVHFGGRVLVVVEVQHRRGLRTMPTEIAASIPVRIGALQDAGLAELREPPARARRTRR